MNSENKYIEKINNILFLFSTLPYEQKIEVQDKIEVVLRNFQEKKTNFDDVEIDYKKLMDICWM